MFARVRNVARDRAGAVLLRLLRDEAGSQLVLIALLMPALIGIAALAIDGGLFGYDQLTLQAAADSAAVSAAKAYGDSSTANFQVEAEAIVAQYGIAGSSPTVTAYHPPKVSGGNCTLAANDPYIGNPGAIEVIVTQPESRALSTIFGSTNSVTLCGRAVACAGTSCSTEYCQFLALDTSGTDITISGNNTKIKGCNLFSNSTSKNSVSCSGQNQTITTPISTVGGESGCSTIPVNTGLTPAATDPYAACASASASCASPWQPTPSGATQTNCTPGSKTCNSALSPGVYSGGITLSTDNTTYTMAAGVYYLVNGGLNVTANSITLSGTGVTIVLTGTAPDQTGVTIDKNTFTLDITAPTNSEWNDGIALWAPESTSGISIGGPGNNITENVAGVIYMPNAAVTYNGNNGAPACIQIIAQSLTLAGNNINFSAQCTTGAPPSQINQSPVLVE